MKRFIRGKVARCSSLSAHPGTRIWFATTERPSTGPVAAPDRLLLSQSKGNRIPYDRGLLLFLFFCGTFRIPTVKGHGPVIGPVIGPEHGGTTLSTEVGECRLPRGFSRLHARQGASRTLYHPFPYRVDTKNHSINYICLLDDRSSGVVNRKAITCIMYCNLKSNPVKCV